MPGPEIRPLVNQLATVESVEAAELLFDEAQLLGDGRLAQAIGLVYDDTSMQNMVLQTPLGLNWRYDCGRSFLVGENIGRSAEFQEVPGQGVLRVLWLGSFTSTRFIDVGDTQDLVELFASRTGNIGLLNKILYRVINEDREQQTEDNVLPYRFPGLNTGKQIWENQGFRLVFPRQMHVTCLKT